uniref:Uncharacterized protein n=1 Tax=Romanomermis culicivorax TaxID=13658 RepID=A0A915HN00_ROMCU
MSSSESLDFRILFPAHLKIKRVVKTSKCEIGEFFVECLHEFRRIIENKKTDQATGHAKKKARDRLTSYVPGKELEQLGQKLMKFFNDKTFAQSTSEKRLRMRIAIATLLKLQWSTECTNTAVFRIYTRRPLILLLLVKMNISLQYLDVQPDKDKR